MKIEGRNAIAEALASGKTLEKALVSSSNIDGAGKTLFQRLKNAGVKIQVVDKAVLDKESETSSHQGFIAYATDFVYSELDEIIGYAESKNETPFIVLLDGVEDVHNLGSIIRSAECLGVHGIVIPKNRSATVNETVIKVSCGATNYMKVAKVTNLNGTIEELKKKGLWIYGADMDGEDIRNCDFSGGVALVVGGEDRGISPLVKKNCDKIVSIKMKGNINSLNASVAGAIAMFEVSSRK